MSSAARGAGGNRSEHVLSGRPARLSGELPLSGPVASSELELELKGAEVRRAAVRRRNGREAGGLGLKVRLPRSTPPGTYRGEARVRGKRFPVVAKVEAHARVRVAPAALSLRAAPGSEVGAEISLTNAGNVSVDVPQRSSFCLFAWSGVNVAFGTALGHQPPEGKERIDVLMDELARYHAGFAQAVVTVGNGPVAPGETRALGVSLTMPDGLVPGRVYSGTWLLHRRNYRVVVEAIADEKAT